MEHDKNCSCETCLATSKCGDRCKKSMGCGTCSGFAYGLAFIGAAIYYIQAATGFWVGVLGVLKAIIWPAMLVYELLGFLGM